MNLNKLSQISTILLILILFAYGKKQKKEQEGATAIVETKTEPFFKISLAQWSFHTMVQEEGTDPFDFAKDAKALVFKLWNM